MPPLGPDRHVPPGAANPLAASLADFPAPFQLTEVCAHSWQIEGTQRETATTQSGSHADNVTDYPSQHVRAITTTQLFSLNVTHVDPLSECKVYFFDKLSDPACRETNCKKL